MQRFVLPGCRRLRALLVQSTFLLFLPSFALGQSDSELLFDPVPLHADYIDNAEASAAPILTELSRPRRADSVDVISDTVNPPGPDPIVDFERVADDIARYQENVSRIQREGGPYDNRLGQELLSLGSRYQQLENWDEALRTFNDALHVNRINNGLFDPGQIPIIEKIVESQLALGNVLAANQRQEYLFYLQQKVAGPRTADLIPSMASYADWNLYVASLRLDLRPNLLELGLQPFPVATFNFSSGLSLDQAFSHLTLAQFNYQEALDLMRSNDTDDSSISATETKLAFSHYLLSSLYQNHQRFLSSAPPRSPASYFYGKNALERRYVYLRETPGVSPARLSSALIEIGDWELLFGNRDSALSIYEASRQSMADLDLPTDEIENLLDPVMPIPIPHYVHPPYSRGSLNISTDTDIDYEGHFDVRFTLNRFGQARNIEFIGAENGSSDVRNMLIRHLNRVRYRPVVKGDEVTEPVFHIRYYYANLIVGGDNLNEEVVID